MDSRLVRGIRDVLLAVGSPDVQAAGQTVLSTAFARIPERRNPIAHEHQHVDLFPERQRGNFSTPLSFPLKDVRDVRITVSWLLHASTRIRDLKPIAK